MRQSLSPAHDILYSICDPAAAAALTSGTNVTEVEGTELLNLVRGLAGSQTKKHFQVFINIVAEGYKLPTHLQRQ